MHLENRTATIGGYTGAADSMRRRNEEHTHRRSAAQRQPANTRSESAGNGPDAMAHIMGIIYVLQLN